MGYIKHEAIIGISWSNNKRPKMEKWIEEREDKIFFALSGIMMNGYWTVICFPDGSKEGWPESDEGDRRRSEFEEFLAELDEYADILYLSKDDEGVVSTRFRKPYLDEV